MAVNVCLQAPKELRSQVEINLSHGEQPPLLKTHLRVLGGTGNEGRAVTSIYKGLPTEHALRMSSSNAVWTNRKAKISLFCFYYNCTIYLKKVHTENEKRKHYLRAHNNVIMTTPMLKRVVSEAGETAPWLSGH